MTDMKGRCARSLKGLQEEETRKRLDEELRLNKRLQLEAHQEVESELTSRLRCGKTPRNADAFKIL